MDSGSWRIAPIPAGPVFAWDRPLLYFAPFVVYRHPLAGVVHPWETGARDTESSARRVVIFPNSDGRAYSQDEFVEYFGRTAGLRDWERAAPVQTPLAPSLIMFSAADLAARGGGDSDKNASSDAFLTDMRKALFRLLDEAERDDVPWRRFRVRNAKLTRTALAWNRLCRKLLLLFLNGRAEQLTFGKVFAIGA